MPARRPVYRYLCLLFTAAFLFLPLAAVSEEAPPSAWQTHATKHTRLHYTTPDDLVLLNRQLAFDRESWSLKDLFSEKKEQTLLQEISVKVDSLYSRVQEILDMRGKNPRVSIHIHPSREALNRTYFRLYHTENNSRAWYVFETNSIYINVQDISEGILAHEIAHSIIDHFLMVKPPTASAEILARYVDSHLHQ